MGERVTGVIGAGIMGSGVAQNLAQKGKKVILIDLHEEILDRSKESIRNALRFQGFIRKEAAVDPDRVMEAITFTTDYRALAEAWFVVENVVEQWPVKREVFARIDTICQESCIFASDTSCIPITKIGSATRRPGRVIGIHFMNPVPMKDTVEVIRGFHTSDETVAATKEFLAGMGKECIVVNDSPGFVSNRVLMLTINEAIFVLQDQVATAREVDQIFKSCFGHRMGPLETADLIGLDTILYSIEVLHESFGDSKYRPSPLLTKMVDAGLLGRKSGKGFYPYQGAPGTGEKQ